MMNVKVLPNLNVCPQDIENLKAGYPRPFTVTIARSIDITSESRKITGEGIRQ